MDGFFDFLKTIAPTIASVAGTPAAGIALEALIGAFDGDEAKAKAILSGEAELSSDDIARIKIAEIAAETRAKELGVELEKIAADDRKSARDREVALRDNVPSILAYLVTAGFFGILGYSLAYGLPSGNGEALLLLLGSLGTAWTGIMAYYFGSSAGSARKTEIMGKVGG